MKREEHKAAVEGKIISVARKLFLEQGYHKTKMRQIKDSASLKMGTIYHFYKNKEDIFAHIVMEAFFRVADRTAKLAGVNTPLHLAAGLAWHVHTMAQHAPSAELYLMSYNSPEISEKLLVNQTDRSLAIFGENLPNLTEQDHKLYAMMVRGFMQTIALQAVAGTLSDPQFTIEKGIVIILRMMHIDEKAVQQILKELHELGLESQVANALTR